MTQETTIYEGKHLTHTGEIVSGRRLQDARDEVSDYWVDLSYAIRKEDLYASHVSEEKKEDILLKSIDFAENIRTGKIYSFTVWQRINNVLTGECIALLP
jgi:hypothetical protein